VIKRFNRYELKYIIPVTAAERIRADLRHVTVPDPYAGENGYPLISLYYDSPALDFFWNKIEGIKFRRKLRVRIYPANPIEATTHGMVEIKQRINRTVQKRRIYLPLEAAHLLCTRGDTPDLDLDEADLLVASEIRYMTESMQLLPTCITAYQRSAYMGGENDPGLRITFDTDVRYRTHALTVNETAENFAILPPDWCIMEVKANERVPDWVTSLISRHNCQLHRVSKYCAGIARSRSFDHLMALAMSPVAKMKGL